MLAPAPVHPPPASGGWESEPAGPLPAFFGPWVAWAKATWAAHTAPWIVCPRESERNAAVCFGFPHLRKLLWSSEFPGHCTFGNIVIGDGAAGNAFWRSRFP